MTKDVRVDTQTLPLGPGGLARSRSSSSAPTAAVSSTSNSAHPFENPTPLTNFLEMLAILLIPAALCYTSAAWWATQRQGWAVLAAMLLMFVPLLGLARLGGAAAATRLSGAGVDQSASALQSGGNMEGKETRFGIADSALWAAATTAASNGSVNSMHDSFTPLGGLVPMWLIQLGEVIFGGVGSGLYGMLVFAIIAVFIAGLMVGRTPEYLGKKIEAYEMKMASLVILIPPFLVADRHGGCGDRRPPAAPAPPIPVRTVSPKSCTPFVGLQQQRQRLCRPVRQHAVLQHVARHLACGPRAYWRHRSGAGDRRQPGAKKHVPAGAGTLPTHTPLFVCCWPHGVIVRRAGILPGAGARADRRRTAVLALIPLHRIHLHADYETSATVARARPLFDPPLVNAAIRDSFLKLAPWVQWRNPVMFVVFVGSVLITGLWLGQLAGGRDTARRRPASCSRSRCGCGHAAVREFRREPGGGPRQGAGGSVAIEQARRDRAAASPRPNRSPYAIVPSSSCGAATWCWSRPAIRFRRRRGDLGHRIGG